MANYKRIFQQGHPYFITIVTHYRNPILIDNIDLLRESFRQAKLRYTFSIEAIVILPDHLHMIILPSDAYQYPMIIKQLKVYFSRHCPPQYYQHIQQSASRSQKGYKPIWQKRYYEHTLRDEQDYRTHFDYIHYNPVKHQLVRRTKDWQYSSFHNYIKKGWYDENWGDCSNDIDCKGE